jgi:hypothetical protein
LIFSDLIPLSQSSTHLGFESLGFENLSLRSLSLRGLQPSGEFRMSEKVICVYTCNRSSSTTYRRDNGHFIIFSEHMVIGHIFLIDSEAEIGDVFQASIDI